MTAGIFAPPAFPADRFVLRHAFHFEKVRA